MRKRIIICSCVLLGILLAGAIIYGLRERDVRISEYDAMDRPARIYPDYSSTVIPPNIAPLNFMVQEKGAYYFAKIYSDKGKGIEVFSRSPKIAIPIDSWHRLLNNNRGGQLHFGIFVRADNHRWVRFSTITNRIASDDIDGYLVYRRMHPTHLMIRGHIGIYQRNLGNFDGKTVLDNRSYMIGCVNCHAFCQNQPGKASMGVRIQKYGKSDVTVLIDGEAISNINAKFGYTAWHPSGKLAAYSINNLPMFFHTTGEEVRDTFDLDSALAYFVVDSKTVRTSPEISKKDQLETWPAWSGDGRCLYFCSTPKAWTAQEKMFPPHGYEKVKYDLVRISYDIESDKWGKVETVISAKDTGLSIAMPRTSPDGHWLMFCMCKYGYFPPWQKDSDLYMMDLKAAEETGRYEYRRLELNSDKSESWHSWSSNSRWITFSSKREHGTFTRCYISYVDESGRAYKPLIVPQKDPAFYNYCIETFNTPEFVTGPIAAAGERLAQVARGSTKVSVEMPITMATPKAKAVSQKGGQPSRE